MSLFRCTQLLSRKNGILLNVLKHSTVYYSDEKKSSDDGAQKDSNDTADKSSDNEKDKQSTNETKPESKNRLNQLLKSMLVRSSSNVGKELERSKPIGYRKLRENQNIDAKERKPRNITDAAKAVSDELGDDAVKKEILAPLGDKPDGTVFLE